MEIAFLVGASLKLVGDYLEVYWQAQAQPHQMEKLEEELARVSGLDCGAKKVKMLLKQKLTVGNIGAIVGRGKSVVQEYVTLAREYHPELFEVESS